MKQLLCATGNEQKFGIGKTMLAEYDIELIQSAVDIDEIQGEDSELIITDKVKRAYEKLGKPVMVTDDSWSIPALRGFPGAYMKSMNHWLEPEDFIHLMQDKTDRTIMLHQLTAYFDGSTLQVFRNDVLGRIPSAPRGTFGPPVMHIAEMERDNGLTISEVYDNGLEHSKARLDNPDDAWRKLGAWLLEQSS